MKRYSLRFRRMKIVLVLIFLELGFFLGCFLYIRTPKLLDSPVLVNVARNYRLFTPLSSKSVCLPPRYYQYFPFCIDYSNQTRDPSYCLRHVSAFTSDEGRKIYIKTDGVSPDLSDRYTARLKSNGFLEWVNCTVHKCKYYITTSIECSIPDQIATQLRERIYHFHDLKLNIFDIDEHHPRPKDGILLMDIVVQVCHNEESPPSIGDSLSLGWIKKWSRTQDSGQINVKKKVIVCSMVGRVIDTRFIRQFVSYYLVLGTGHIVLYYKGDPNLFDCFLDELDSYIQHGVVSVVDWNNFDRYGNVWVDHIAAQNDCLHRYSDFYQGVGYFDADEYVTLVGDGNLIGNLAVGYDIPRFNSVALKSLKIGLKWKDDTDLFIDSFFTREVDSHFESNFRKCIFYPHKLHTVSVHEVTNAKNPASTTALLNMNTQGHITHFYYWKALHKPVEARPDEDGRMTVSNGFQIAKYFTPLKELLKLFPKYDHRKGKCLYYNFNSTEIYERFIA